jgi:hypothetical protein
MGISVGYSTKVIEKMLFTHFDAKSLFILTPVPSPREFRVEVTKSLFF